MLLLFAYMNHHHYSEYCYWNHGKTLKKTMVRMKLRKPSKARCPRSSKREEKLQILPKTMSFGKNTTTTYSLMTRSRTATSNSLPWLMHGSSRQNKVNKFPARFSTKKGSFLFKMASLMLMIVNINEYETSF